jgi:hypothetical protein
MNDKSLNDEILKLNYEGFYMREIALMLGITSREVFLVIEAEVNAMETI